MRKIISSAFMLLPLIISAVAPCDAAGIRIGRTRVIYDANKKEVALSLANEDNELPWLVQSWTDTGDGKTRGPFILTPPLFRLDPQKEQNLRIAWSGAAVAQDRESLFYINIRTIPAVAKEDSSTDKNVLRLIYKTRLKLFYRPKGLAGTPGESCKDLHFSHNGSVLRVVNDGGFYSVFDSVKLGSTLLKKADMVVPKSSTEIPLPPNASGQTITWRCISDYSNATPSFTTSLSKG
ncbi:MAG: fimbrial biogenesis chaperone [Kluyvera sp.]